VPTRKTLAELTAENALLRSRLAALEKRFARQENGAHDLGVKEDSTECNKAEETLRLNEARLEALLRFSTMTAASEKEITDFALEEGVRLTNSKIGYLHFINAIRSVCSCLPGRNRSIRIAPRRRPAIIPWNRPGMGGLRAPAPLCHSQRLPESAG